jgi:hypothetical protein
MNIDTNQAEAAATKWNFLPFKPGLVVVIVSASSLLLSTESKNWAIILKLF